MKREIKFKGLRVDGGGWVYGFYIESSSEHHSGKGSLIVCGDRCTTYAGKDFIKVIPETVSQFTGLKDKNGVDIYEGDILECEYIKNWSKLVIKKYVVYWNESGYWCAGSNGLFETSLSKGKIIGDIHENPELI